MLKSVFKNGASVRRKVHGAGAGNALGLWDVRWQKLRLERRQPSDNRPGLAPPFSGDSTWPSGKRGAAMRTRPGKSAGKGEHAALERLFQAEGGASPARAFMKPYLGISATS